MRFLMITLFTGLFTFTSSLAAQNHLCEFKVEVKEVMRSLSLGENQGQFPVAVVKILIAKDLGDQQVCQRYIDINLFAIKLESHEMMKVLRKGNQVNLRYHFRSKVVNNLPELSTTLELLD